MVTGPKKNNSPSQNQNHQKTLYTTLTWGVAGGVELVHMESDTLMFPRRDHTQCDTWVAGFKGSHRAWSHRLASLHPLDKSLKL